MATNGKSHSVTGRPRVLNNRRQAIPRRVMAQTERIHRRWRGGGQPWLNAMTIAGTTSVPKTATA